MVKTFFELEKELEEKGYIFLDNEEIEHFIQYKDLISIDKLNIKFMNESYFYTYKDNRFGLKVVEIEKKSFCFTKI